ncbi:MAG: PRD domain-containing protein [Spirochaetales bacterium]|jgi:transcriptional antiterminator|nr:PRD domain-containing protein [Spirochaetales bacterium]
MDLEERLAILVNGGVISPAAENTVRRIIDRFDRQWRIKLTEENGGRLITHLAGALMRQETESPVNPLAREHFEEFKASPYFEKARAITGDLFSHVSLDLIEEEQDYLIIHICLILDDIYEG